MRILFLTENFPPEMNAAATRVFERACYWTRWGHEVTVITQAPNFPFGKLFDGYENRWYQSEDMAGIRVVRVKTYMSPNEGFARRILDFTSFMAAATAASLFERRPDVVVATSPQFFTAVAGWMSGALRRVPFVFELGDLWPSSIAAVGAMDETSTTYRALEALELFLYRRAAAVAALTQPFKADLVRRGIEADKIAVVLNGVDLGRYAPRGRDEALAREWDLEDRFVVGYVGTHGMAHALMNVLDAAELLREETNVRFLLAGAGAERDKLMREAEKRGLDGRHVVFLPAQPKERMPQVWSLCDVALVHLKDSPVFADVIPSKIFEAMGMGLPILLAAPAGEASRIVEDDGAGLCVAPEDPHALADAVRRLKNDGALRRTLAASSHAAAPAHTRERQAEEMLRVLQFASGGKGGEVGRDTAGPDGASAGVGADVGADRPAVAP